MQKVNKAPGMGLALFTKASGALSMGWRRYYTEYNQSIIRKRKINVRKHLTGGFLCAVLDLSGILCSLLIPEYSGIKRRGKPLLGQIGRAHVWTPVTSCVRKHWTGGFLCAVLDLSGVLCYLLIPEYSGIKRRGKPLQGAEESRHFLHWCFYMVISTLFLLVNHTVKVIIYKSLSLIWIACVL